VLLQQSREFQAPGFFYAVISGARIEDNTPLHFTGLQIIQGAVCGVQRPHFIGNGGNLSGLNQRHQLMHFLKGANIGALNSAHHQGQHGSGKRHRVPVKPNRDHMAALAQAVETEESRCRRTDEIYGACRAAAGHFLKLGKGRLWIAVI